MTLNKKIASEIQQLMREVFPAREERLRRDIERAQLIPPTTGQAALRRLRAPRGSKLSLRGDSKQVRCVQ